MADILNPQTPALARRDLMKLGAGVLLWALIAVIFAKWAHRHMEAERVGVRVSERDVLTWDDVEAELTRLEQLGK